MARYRKAVERGWQGRLLRRLRQSERRGGLELMNTDKAAGIGNECFGSGAIKVTQKQLITDFTVKGGWGGARIGT